MVICVCRFVSGQSVFTVETTIIILGYWKIFCMGYGKIHLKIRELRGSLYKLSFHSGSSTARTSNISTFYFHKIQNIPLYMYMYICICIFIGTPRRISILLVTLTHIVENNNIRRRKRKKSILHPILYERTNGPPPVPVILSVLL